MLITVCGDIVFMISLVYVVEFNSRKILLINPPMGWGSNRGIVMFGENPPMVL
jgi:hypothetical protein